MLDISSPATTRSQVFVAAPAQPLVPVCYLTLLYHPVVERIGERAELSELSGGGALLSRQFPLFFHPHDLRGVGGGRPLDDEYISRTPVRIERDGEDTLSIHAEEKHALRVDGRECNSVQLSMVALDEGVVIDLHHRVVLLLHRALPLSPIDNDCGLLGFSHAIEALRHSIQKMTDLDVPVLIRGESGTGKELVAQALHGCSPRAAGPFVAVNIAAMPESLSSALLFGAEKGAYTGAARAQKGHFTEADGGSIFLDEVGDCQDSVQLTLLRVLETKTVQALGATHARALDVRIISATDAPLEDKLAKGEFRLPLFQRLATVELPVPALRERRADIGLLLSAFLRGSFATLGEEKRWQHTLCSQPMTAQIFSRCCRYAWPGNVRQLKNYAMQMAVASRGETQLCLPEPLQRNLPGKSHEVSFSQRETIFAQEVAPTKRTRPRDISPQTLERVLCEQQWDFQATARALNISRSSLYTLIDKHPKLRRARDISNAEIIAAFHRYQGCMTSLVDALHLSMPALRRRLSEIGDDALSVPAATPGEKAATAPRSEARVSRQEETAPAGG